MKTHAEVIANADRARDDAKAVIAAARARLQAANNLYDERLRRPRHG